MKKYHEPVEVVEVYEYAFPVNGEDFVGLAEAVKSLAAENGVTPRDVIVEVTGDRWDATMYLNLKRDPTEEEIAKRKAAAAAERARERERQRQQYERLKKKFDKS